MKTPHILLKVLSISSLLAQAGIEVAKTQDPEYPAQTHYLATGPECEISWTVERSQESTGAFGLREGGGYECAVSPREQIAYRSALLSRVAQDTDDLKNMRAFAWGQMLRGDANDEHALRMTAAFRESKQWDATKGRPRSARLTTNKLVLTVLKEKKIFSEVVQTFAAKNFDLEVLEVEAIQISNGKTKLPVSASVLFSVKKSF